MPDRSFVVQVQLRELRVSPLEIQRDVPLRAAVTGADFGKLVFEAVRQVDSNAMLVARHRIADRFADDVEYALDMNPAASGIDIDIEVDLRKDRIECLLERRCEYGEHGGERLGVLPRHDFQNG